MDFSSLPLLIARQADNITTEYTSPFENCTNVTPECPIDETIYGYAPSLGANAFFLAIFAICMVAQLGLSIRSRTWTYLIALCIGCFGEVVGYVGRIILNDNAWSDTGFQIQICCLIIAPAFITAGVYLTLKHIVIELGPQYSMLPPRYYTWIFILCDLLSLILQGAGGGLAATADDGSSLQDSGNDLMMAGIVWQVITLLAFGALCALYAVRIRANRNSLPPSAYALLKTLRFKMFLLAVLGAYLTIFTRCVYRIAEMSRGWASEIMRDEAGFIACEGIMVVIATLLLTVFHPGLAFPEMQMHKSNGVSGQTEQEKDVESSSRE